VISLFVRRKTYRPYSSYRRNERKKFNYLYLLALLPLALAFSYLAPRSPILVEKIFSLKFYRIIAQGVSRITGIFPFSVAEVIIVAAILIAIVQIIRSVKELINSPRKRIRVLMKKLSVLAVILSLIYFLFITMWGLNYHRLPFEEIVGLDMQDVKPEELEALSRYLVDRANELRELVEENSDGIMILPDGVNGGLKRADLGYKAASVLYPELGGKYGRPKGVMLSKVMSYQGIGGVYFPFTAEANVNISGPHFMIPATALHEMAHQRGFARENEANYIAYITAAMHPDYDFQYSGTMLALIHTMGALRRLDSPKATEIRQQYSPGVLRDLEDWNKHLAEYEGIINRVSNAINNKYLQVNAQTDGVLSYNRMVHLLVAHYRGELKE
jgi:hypothetical protein